MQWLDIAGPPGVGKSTLVDGLWPPRVIRAKGVSPPPEWRDFLKITDRLLKQIRNHESFAACNSMVTRSFAKMAAVNADTSDSIYIQTGFTQRGLGIGWRMSEPYDVCEYFEHMPVSLGVVLLSAPVEVVKRRNVERGKDRSYMVPLMVKPLAIAAEVLKLRSVPVLELNTTESVSANVTRIIDFAKGIVGDTDATTTRYCYQGTAVQSSGFRRRP